MILHGHEHAELLAMHGALAQRIGHPGLDVGACGTGSGGLPFFVRRLRSREDTDRRRTEPSGHFDPFLGHAHAFRAHGLVRRGEVIAHAGAADVKPEIVCVLLDAVHITVRRSRRIAGKEVTREIHRRNVLLRGEIAHAKEVDARLGVRGIRLKLLQKRIRIQSRPKRCPADAADGFQRPCCER